MTNLEQKVAQMPLSKALEIANANTILSTSEEEEQLLVATLKIKALSDILTPALSNATKVLVKHAQTNNKTISGSTILSIHEGNKNIPIQLEINVGPQVKTTDVIDWETLKADKHVTIEDDPQDPKIKHISVGSVDDWQWFKAPAMLGNPTAVNSAINSHNLDAKYQTTKTTSKYGMTSQTTVLESK